MPKTVDSIGYNHVFALEDSAVDDDNRKLDVGRERFISCSSLRRLASMKWSLVVALLEAISIGKLLDDFFVTAHRQSVHDLVPDGFFDQGSALEQLVAAQTEFLCCFAGCGMRGRAIGTRWPSMTQKPASFPQR